MAQEAELLHATLPTEDSESTELDRAASVANRVLSENGMVDYKTTKDHASYWKNYFIFEYFLIKDPRVRPGGGATLVVRSNDMLGGMVYCSSDMLEEDIDVLLANIPKAFSAFDAKSRE
ncbi:hypothetical protein [Roseovarius sp. 2305UL8-3]|uniref:hypothetical protein n=1 Tax=Roseovarius conchicola TaxID=3121636 RepID=UPI003526CFF0